MITILIGSRVRPTWVGGMVAVYITGAYWFTASTSFANPAVTLARAATNTFAGIRPVDAPGFIAAELVGGVAAIAVAGWFARESAQTKVNPEAQRTLGEARGPEAIDTPSAVAAGLVFVEQRVGNSEAPRVST